MATAGAGRGAGPERAFVAALPPSGVVRLDAEEGRHLVRVRRVRAGEEVVLFDGRGRQVRARLLDERVGRDGGPEAEVLGDAPAREPRRDVAVGVAFPGAGRADDLVFALAVLGVDLLVPLRTERGEADPEAVLGRRLERFERLAREAAKVNGRSRLLRVSPPRALADLWAAGRAAGEAPPEGPDGRRPAEAYASILCDTDPAARPLPALLAERPAPLLLVGPEGGFSDAEVEAARAAGVPSASLGGCALRTEIAAAAAAAVALAQG